MKTLKPSNIKIAIAVFCLSVFLSDAGLQAQIGERTNGMNANYVRVTLTNGAEISFFVEGTNADGTKQWKRVTDKVPDGVNLRQSSFDLKEVSRNKDSVHLTVRGRANFELNLTKQKMFYNGSETGTITYAWETCEGLKGPTSQATTTGTEKSPIYAVVGLEHDSKFVLKQSDKYVGKYYSGKSYYYPQVNQEPEVLQFAGDRNVPLRYGDEIKIKSTNTSAWTASWRSYNLLGAFADGVYYWDGSQTDKVTWKIESADGSANGTPMGSGAKIRLFNKSYSQYLYPNGGITNTKAAADNDTIWTIQWKQ